MKRLIVAGGGALLMVLAAAGCGQAQGAAKSPAASHKSGHAAQPSVMQRAKGWLPTLSATQVTAGHLQSRPWTLLHLTQNGTVAEIKYTYGGCQPKPKGVLVTAGGSKVTMSLEAPRLAKGTLCPPDLIVGTARVLLPTLSGHTLEHGPIGH
jgi:hypothetical protein